MSDVRFSSSSVRVARVRRGLARFFGRTATGLFVLPILALMLLGLLRAAGIPISGSRDLLFLSWFYAWIPGVPLAGLLSWVAGIRVRKPFTKVEVEDGAIRFLGDGRPLVVPRQRIEGAFFVASPRASEVEIALPGGDALCLELGGRDEEIALLHALGFGPSERRTVIPLDSGRASFVSGCSAAFGAIVLTAVSTCGVALASQSFPILNHVGPFLVGFVFVGAALLFSRSLAPTRLVVGADGVTIDKPLGKEFVPFSALVDAGVTGAGTVLQVKTGGLTRTIKLSDERDARGHAIVDRIRQARAFAEAGSAEVATAIVGRGDRSLAEWREALRRLSQGAGDYRGRPITSEALLRTAASLEASAEQRLGAAMAIGLGDDTEAKERLRIAVEGIANDELRIAMESAVEGGEEEAAIEEAIAAERRARG